MENFYKQYEGKYVDVVFLDEQGRNIYFHTAKVLGIFGDFIQIIDKKTGQICSYPLTKIYRMRLSKCQ